MPRPNRPDLRSWEWYYYLALCHSDLITLRGDTDGVSSVAWSPDGKWLASAGGDGTLTIWNAVSGKKIRTLTGHQAQSLDRLESGQQSPCVRGPGWYGEGLGCSHGKWKGFAAERPGAGVFRGMESER